MVASLITIIIIIISSVFGLRDVEGGTMNDPREIRFTWQISLACERKDGSLRRSPPPLPPHTVLVVSRGAVGICPGSTQG